MKKIIFTLIAASFTIFQLNAQVIEDFEMPKYQLQFSDVVDSSTLTFVANPDTTGINKSTTVLKFETPENPNFWTNIVGPISPFKSDGTQYCHLKVFWKDLTTGTSFGYGGAGGEGPIDTPTVVNGWEELVYPLPAYDYPAYEFNILLGGTGGKPIICYFDDIYFNHDPALGSKPEVVIADFEPIPMNLMLGGAEDNSSISVSPNPDKNSSEVNVSSNVAKFIRDKDGVPWGGFWSTLSEPLDITANKYMHVNVWKSRISPVKFKIEGGAAGNLEIESINPQTKINEWEDMVFDLSSKTGTYSIIAFMPDFQDPVSLSDDIIIYFDDIVLNNDPLPRKVSELTINVDMALAKLRSDEKVYVIGDFGGIYGTHNLNHTTLGDGTIPACELTDPDNDGIYTIKMKLPDELFKFELVKGKIYSWMGDYGIWPEKRTVNLNGNTEVTYKWQLGGFRVAPEDTKKQEFIVDMRNAGNTTGQKVYIAGDFGGIHANWAVPGTNANNELTDPDGDGKYSITMYLPDGDYLFKFFKGTGWGGGEWPGDPNREVKITGSKSIICEWGTQGIKYLIDGFNMVTDGNFDSVEQFYSTWEENNYYPDSNSVQINDGILSLNNIIKAEFWEIGATQRLNDHGKYLENDSVYIMKFDAWASINRVSRFSFEDNQFHSYNRPGLSEDLDAMNGRCEWNINLTTEKTTYIRIFKGYQIEPNSSFLLRIYAAEEEGTVHVDNVCLFKMSDLQKYGIKVSKIIVTGEGGETTITNDKGKLQMHASLFPEDAWIKNIAWSVFNQTGNAYINEKGMLTAISDGKVAVIANALDGSNISDSLEITISNQEFLRDSIIDFENISDMAWNVMNNGINSYWLFSLAPNPSTSKVNPSENVLRFVVNNKDGIPTNASSTAFGPVCFKCGDNFGYLSIRKPVKTVVGIKLEQSTNGGPDTLITATSNAVDVWQKLKFDFSSVAGHSYQKITIYPDVKAVSKPETVFYIDNIEFGCTDCTTEISDNKTSTIRIYPNPVNDILNVVLNQRNTKLTIYNSLGCKIDEFISYENTAEIDVSHYSPGVYLLSSGDGSVVKFVK